MDNCRSSFSGLSENIKKWVDTQCIKYTWYIKYSFIHIFIKYILESSNNIDFLRHPILIKDLRFRFSNCENVGATNPSNLTQSHTYFFFYLIGFNFWFPSKEGLFLKIRKAPFQQMLTRSNLAPTGLLHHRAQPNYSCKYSNLLV